MLVQAITLLVLFLSLRVAARSMIREIVELRASVQPIISNTNELISATRELISHVSPKIEGAVDDVAGITRLLRARTDEIQSLASEAVERLRSQLLLLDAMISSLLDRVDRVGSIVIESVGKPVRQISALFASAKAAIGALRNPPPRRL
jgi:hypothetical protein